MYNLIIEYQTIGVRGTKRVRYFNVTQLRVNRHGISFYLDDEIITINNVISIKIERAN